MVPDQDKLIDLQKELPAPFLRWLPSFALRPLDWLFHLDELNAFWRAHREKEGLEFLTALLSHLEVDFKTQGARPDFHRKIIVCNHPNGILDGLVLLKLLGTHHPTPKVLANASLQKLIPLQKLFLPIEKPNGATASRLSKDAARQIEEALKGDAPILVFPAGQVAKLYHNGVREMPWNKFIIQKALRHKRDIVPLFLNGGVSWRFHALSITRRLLRLKIHPEAALLPDEAWRARGQNLKVHIGNSISWQTFAQKHGEKKHSAKNWAEILRTRTLALPTANPTESLSTESLSTESLSTESLSTEAPLC